MLETERKQLLIYALSAILFFISTLIIMLSVDPFTAGRLLLSAFYLSLALFFTSLFTALFYLARVNSIQLLPYEKQRIALREAALLTLLVVGSLFLSSRELLYWWVEIVFIFAVVLIETYFLL